MTYETTSTGEQSSADDARWETVTRRDKTADGAFVYSVRTTGI